MHDSLHINSKNTTLPDLERKLRSPVAYTLETKIDLLEELKTKHEVDAQLLSQLENDINEEFQEIENLDHLQNLGYVCLGLDLDLMIKRRGSAIAMDITGVFIGFVFLLMGLMNIFGMGALIGKEGQSAMMLYTGIFAMFCLGTVGLALMVRSIYRFIDHMSFRIIKDGAIIKVQKRTDLAVERIDIDKNEVALIEKGDKLWINIGKIKAFEVENPSIYTRKTLEVLERKLRA